MGFKVKFTAAEIKRGVERLDINPVTVFYTKSIIGFIHEKSREEMMAKIDRCDIPSQIKEKVKLLISR